MPFTAKELATRIARTEDAVQPAFERIRHWTREGLLSVDGELNPGTGRKREYAETEVVKAKTLNAMANFGISLKTMRSVAELVNNNEINEAKARGKTIILFVHPPLINGRDEIITKYIFDDDDDPKRWGVPASVAKVYDCVLVINLTHMTNS
jgi:DNA-binding transcriptional MerR regulator